MWWNRNKKMCCPCQGCMETRKVYDKKFVSLVKGMLEAQRKCEDQGRLLALGMTTKGAFDRAQQIFVGAQFEVEDYLKKMEV